MSASPRICTSRCRARRHESAPERSLHLPNADSRFTLRLLSNCRFQIAPVPGPRHACRARRRRVLALRMHGESDLMAEAQSSWPPPDPRGARRPCSMGTVGNRAASARWPARRPCRPACSRVSGRGPTNSDPGSPHRRRANTGDLGEESVAGMDGVGPGFPRDPHDLVHREVGGDRTQPLADEVGLVGLGAMQREAVLVGEHRHRGLAHLVGRTQDPNRDLAAIGHQDLCEPAH